MLEEMNRNIEVLNQMIGSHSRSIQLTRTLMSYGVPPLHSNELLGLPSNTRINLTNGESVGKSPKWSACSMKTVVWTLTLTEGPVKLGKPSDHSACCRVRLVSPNGH
ncbi:hypothetical protein H5410_026417 [Solanum commersonii]|uniref:Uncharacterized protein n=1 Tax=Solanum commersonii TaxID=4109 RepID=A0A9J5YYJ5_SOLCO|nr:hypothetical protein H5410_026417 [Solanum commersonii]